MKGLFGGFFSKGNIKRMTPYIAVFAVGVALMYFGSIRRGESDSPITAIDESKNAADSGEVLSLLESENVSSDYERLLEEKLERTLSNVEGVGSVKAALTLTYKSHVELAEDTTYELAQTESAGGDATNRTERTETRHVLVTGKDGGTSPIVIKDIRPKVEGAIIVAEGGGDPEIKAALTKAAAALLNLPAHKIEVLQMGNK